MERAFKKKSPLRSGNIDKAEEYGPYVLRKMSLFWEMGMSQKIANGDVLVQRSTAVLLSDRAGSEITWGLQVSQVCFEKLAA